MQVHNIKITTKILNLNFKKEIVIKYKCMNDEFVNMKYSCLCFMYKLKTIMSLHFLAYVQVET